MIQEESVLTTEAKIDSKKFLEDIIIKFDHIRVGVGGGIAPFKFIYFKVDKEEIEQMFEHGESEITYSVMRNSVVNSKYEDVLYINAVKTIL